MQRREFLKVAGGVALAGSLLATAPVRAAGAGPARRLGSAGPYGPLLDPDANGFMLPEGFTSVELARSLEPVGPNAYEWPRFPDGGATFRVPGGWIYTSNSEVPNPGEGGVGALRFDRAGEVVDAYPLLEGTQTNCAGGPTPWGTWLSCEEHPEGQVWECDPTGDDEARPLPALGVFQHEAAAVDPRREHVYLTEDVSDGRFYRFVPRRYPSLDAGILEVAAVDDRGRVRWLEVPDPAAADEPTREQVPESTAFDGGEGIWYQAGTVYFTTKGDDKVWAYDVKRERLETVHDPEELPDTPLNGVDNITMTPGGNLLIAEDHTESQELILITPAGDVEPLLRMDASHEGSELCGPAFSPGGEWMYFSSQRGGGGPGVTYAVTGPFERKRWKDRR